MKICDTLFGCVSIVIRVYIKNVIIWNAQLTKIPLEVCIQTPRRILGELCWAARIGLTLTYTWMRNKWDKAPKCCVDPKERVNQWNNSFELFSFIRLTICILERRFHAHVLWVRTKRSLFKRQLLLWVDLSFIENPLKMFGAAFKIQLIWWASNSVHRALQISTHEFHAKYFKCFLPNKYNSNWNISHIFFFFCSSQSNLLCVHAKYLHPTWCSLEVQIDSSPLWYQWNKKSLCFVARMSTKYSRQQQQHWQRMFVCYGESFSICRV